MPRKQRFKPSRKPKPVTTGETTIEPTRTTNAPPNKAAEASEEREELPEVEPRDRRHEG